MPEPPAGPATPGAGTAPVRVVLADDSVLFREGIARVLAENGFVVAGQAMRMNSMLWLSGKCPTWW
jgi:serine/threonine-protein kinase